MLGYGEWGWACGATKLVFVILIDFGLHSFVFVIIICLTIFWHWSSEFVF